MAINEYSGSEAEMTSQASLQTKLYILENNNSLMISAIFLPSHFSKLSTTVSNTNYSLPMEKLIK